MKKSKRNLGSYPYKLTFTNTLMFYKDNLTTVYEQLHPGMGSTGLLAHDH